MPSVIRQLFQGRPARRPTTLLTERLRVVLRASVEQTGNGGPAAEFARRFSPLFVATVAAGAFPVDARQMRAVRGMPPLSTPIRAMEFVALTLLPSATRLAEFQGLLEGDWQTAEIDQPVELLAEVRRKFGFSAWLAGEEAARLAADDDGVSRYFRALDEGDKIFLCGLLARARFVARAGSTAVTDLDRQIREWEYPKALRPLISAWAHPAPQLSHNDICSVLAFAVQLPAIDQWILLQRCMGAFLAPSDFAARLSELRAAIVLNKLLATVGGVFANNLRELAGARVTGGAEAVDPGSPNSLESILAAVLASESVGKTTDDSAKQPLGVALAGLVEQDSGAVEGHLAVLAREAVVVAGTRLGTVLAAVVAQCVSLTERRARFAVNWVRLFAHPALVKASGGGRVGHMLRVRRIAERRHIFETLVAASNNEQHREVIDAAAKEGTEGIEETAILLDGLLAIGERDSAIECANDIILKYPGFAKWLPIRELVDVIPEEVATDLASGVHRAVLANFCAQFEFSGAVTKRNDYLEDVLDLAGVSFPSEAIDQIFAATPAPVAFQFFESVCVSAVMDTVPVGRSTEELLNERIRILSALRLKAIDAPTDGIAKADGVAERLELEMKDVATYLAVTSELASLDQRRVYVDTEGLRLRLGTTLAGDFQRYRRFAALDIQSDRDLDQLRRLLTEQFPDMTFVEVSEISRALTSESDRALSKMLLQIRDGFAVSHEFGLDGYLSGGIRHGNLEFHLREPFMKGELLGVLRSDGGFTLPTFASNLIEWCPDSQGQDSIRSEFHRLAKGLRELTDEVLMEWVQVDLEAKRPKALFQLSMTQVEARVLEPLLRQAPSLEQFIDVCISHWWAVVDDCLQGARNRIHGELHERLLSLLRRLDSGCGSALTPPALQQILREQVGTVVDATASAITKLAEWFQRPTAGATGDVEAATAVDVCLSLLNGLFPQLKLHSSVEITPPSAKLGRREFKHWVDIIHVLLVNAAEHGGAVDQCDIGVRWLFDEAGVVLTISNALGPGVDTESIDASLEASRLKRAEKAALSRVRTEGSSGLIKVMKYARADLRCPSANVAVVRRGNKVEATVTLPTRHANKQQRASDHDATREAS